MAACAQKLLAFCTCTMLTFVAIILLQELGQLEIKHGLLQLAESLSFLHTNARLIHCAISPEVRKAKLLIGCCCCCYCLIEKRTTLPKHLCCCQCIAWKIRVFIMYTFGLPGLFIMSAECIISFVFFNIEKEPYQSWIPSAVCIMGC